MFIFYFPLIFNNELAINPEIKPQITFVNNTLTMPRGFVNGNASIVSWTHLS